MRLSRFSPLARRNKTILADSTQTDSGRAKRRARHAALLRRHGLNGAEAREPPPPPAELARERGPGRAAGRVMAGARAGEQNAPVRAVINRWGRGVDDALPSK
jgi:hypothetical protein